MLSDYRVLDLSDERGALCGQLLADLGAEVVRIEPPGGSSMRTIRQHSLVWEVYARNCTSLIVDLDTSAGQSRLQALAGEADLVIVSGDAVERVDVVALEAANPALVIVIITPFGATGPKRDYAATDLIVQAASGAMAITGFADSTPLRTGAITAWSHAGAAAAGGALLALRQRDRTGRGQRVDISAQQATALAASYSLLTPYIGASRMRRAGHAAAAAAIPFVWPCRNGFVSMTLGFAGPMMTFANNLLGWMRREGALDEELATLDWPTYLGSLRDGGDPAKIVALNAALSAFLAARSKEELLAGAIQWGVLIVPVATTQDLLQSPQLADRDFWWHTRGVRMPGAFARFARRPARLTRAAPALGEHDEPLYRPRERSLASVAPHGSLPLDGMRILDFSWVMAGPWSTRVMADYGATVVKVESRTRLDLVRVLGPFYGDRPTPETSGSFASINAGKLSFEVDPNTLEGKATILELVDWADVVVESFSPRAMKKWGLDYAALAARKPEIIMLSTCLFGQTGPYASMAGYGTMGAALGGLVQPTGIPGRPPCGPFGPYTDYVAPRFSVIAMLAALHHRDRTGEGQHIDQSQAESAMHYLALAVAEASVRDGYPDRLANSDPDLSPHDVYPCAGDDQWVAIAIRDARDWSALVAEIGSADLGRPALVENEARRAASVEVDRIIAGWTAPQQAVDVEVRLQRVGVPAHAVMNAAIVEGDAQLAHRQHFVRSQHAHLGEVTIESVGYRFSDMTPRVGRIPSLGADGEYVRREILRHERLP